MKELAKEILILGAGAAGLACAATLKKAGCDSFALLEARGRIGGRTLTRRQNSYPLELGAEFIHGAPRFTLDLLEKHRLPFFDVADRHLNMQKGKTSEPDFESVFEELGKRLDPERDLCIAEFIDLQKDFSEEKKALLKNFVSGFHAADLNIMGEKALHMAGAANEGDLNGVEMFRLPLGYDHLFKTLAAQDEIHLGTEVREIAWNKNAVEIKTANGRRWRAAKVVVTFPLGVLQAGTLQLKPEPDGYQTAISELRMGHVQRLIFVFKTRFWEKLTDQPVGFLHATKGDFPVWWTTSPARTPYLTAWQGGPRAEVMADWTLRERAEAALRNLSEMTGRPYDEIRAETLKVWNHNWSKDRFAHGAYSYIARGSQDRWRRLQEGFEDTLYFAGEALADGAERGTVHGALHSGIAAAEKVLSARK